MSNIKEMVSFILEKTKKNMEKFGENTPVAVIDGRNFRYASIDDWRLGFWGGILNYCYVLSGEEKFLGYADIQEKKLKDKLYNHPQTLDHDIGFLYEPTALTKYYLKGDEESLRIAIDASDVLISRYNPKGKYIKAWNEWPTEPVFSKEHDRRIIIDCMFNLPLLFEISKITGDKKYYEVAYNHAETCRKTIVRKDGTTYHTFLFDRETGAPDKGETWQGYADESCWSRGQAWAVGGFTMAYRYTKDENFLKTAILTADKFIELLDDDFMPAWDFEFRNQGAVPDASASAITACGLLELCEYVDKEKGDFYRETARKLIDTLWEKCASKDDDSYEALIKRCTGFHRVNSEVDTGIIYGDYYFVKAVTRLYGKEWII